MEADVPRGSWIAVERHRLAIEHAVLLSPSAMGFADVDLQLRVGGPPLSKLPENNTKLLHVLRCPTMLGDVHPKTIVDQNAGQVGMTIQESSFDELGSNRGPAYFTTYVRAVRRSWSRGSRCKPLPTGWATPAELP